MHKLLGLNKGFLFISFSGWFIFLVLFSHSFFFLVWFFDFGGFFGGAGLCGGFFVIFLLILFFSWSFFLYSWVKLSCWSSRSWWPVSKENSQKYPSHLAINTQHLVSLFLEPFGLLSWITMGSCATTERLQSVGLYHHFHNLRTLSCNLTVWKQT